MFSYKVLQCDAGISFMHNEKELGMSLKAADIEKVHRYENEGSQNATCFCV